MANAHGSALHSPPSTRPFRQSQLFALISLLCAARDAPHSPDVCRLIVEGSLSWSVEPVDANRSWLYLPRPARVQQIADCLIVTAA
jgi:hypothetical protein